MRVANDGSLQLYYSRENAGNDQNSVQMISHDDGETWSKRRTISGGGIVSRDGMLGIAEFDGSLIAVFETNDTGVFSIKSVSSNGMLSSIRR
jgi:Neuraminidase (sialidase)